MSTVSTYTLDRDVRVSILIKCKSILRAHAFVRRKINTTTMSRVEVEHPMFNLEMIVQESRQGIVLRACIKPEKIEVVASELNICPNVLRTFRFIFKIMPASVSAINETGLGALVFSRSSVFYNALQDSFILSPSRAPFMACSVTHHLFLVSKEGQDSWVYKPCDDVNADLCQVCEDGKHPYLVSLQEDVASFSSKTCDSLCEHLKRFVLSMHMTSTSRELDSITCRFKRFLWDVIVGVCCQLIGIRRTSVSFFVHNDLHSHNIIVSEHPSTISWYNGMRTDLKFTPYLIDFGLSSAEGPITMFHDVTSPVFHMYNVSPTANKWFFGEDMISLLTVIINTIGQLNSRHVQTTQASKTLREIILKPVQRLLSEMTVNFGFQSSIMILPSTPHAFVPIMEGSFDVIVLNPSLKLWHSTKPQSLHIPISCLWYRRSDATPYFAESLRKFIENKICVVLNHKYNSEKFYSWVLTTFHPVIRPSLHETLLNLSSEHAWAFSESVRNNPRLKTYLRAAMSLRALEHCLCGNHPRASSETSDLLRRVGLQQRLDPKSKELLLEALYGLIEVRVLLFTCFNPPFTCSWDLFMRSHRSELMSMISINGGFLNENGLM